MSVTARPLGRQELLSWLNEITHSDIAKVLPLSLQPPDAFKYNPPSTPATNSAVKVEHCCDGVACLKLLDALHPGKVSFKKVGGCCGVRRLRASRDVGQQVNAAAKFPEDRLKNLKILQKVKFCSSCAPTALTVL